MSERYLILAEYPLRVNPLKLAFSGRAFIKNYRWQPEQGTRFQVFDRETGAHRGTYETDAFFAFHHVNAFERGGDLVIDLVAFEDNAIIDSLYLGEDGPVGAIPPSELRRYTIGLESGSVRSEPLAEGNVELPRIDYRRRNTQDYRFAYFTGMAGDWLDRLVKVDVGQGEVASWAEDGCYPGEPIFVREPGTEGEDDGRDPLGGARHPGGAVVPARARRAVVRRAGPGRGSAPHPVRLPRAVPAMSAPELRASDAERERVAERLRDAAAEGRLTPDELEERLGRALSAQTRGQLEPTVADLPQPRERPGRRARRMRPELPVFLTTSVLLVVIWALSGMGYFWPAWPILGWGVFVVGPGRLRRLVA